ncbi:hypothetical protein CWS31_017365 [Colwellia echini]|uniref:DUF4149 domain-containing protein n=2 Tax=Colwellia echini TaxID=1982103 RepID=A0ABY3MSL7_9GAMM|nr:hypothetical protein CWS31_017365 [Colwellia echini]
MQSIESLALGVRLLGIFLFVTLLRDMPLTIETISQYKSFDPSLNTSFTMNFYTAVSVISIAFSLAMIKFPVFISKKLIAKTITKSPIISSDLDIAKVTGITLLGIYILSWAIPDLVNNLIGLSQAKEYAPHDKANIAYIWNSLITTVVEIGIGLYCMFSASGLIKLVKMARK